MGVDSGMGVDAGDSTDAGGGWDTGTPPVDAGFDPFGDSDGDGVSDLIEVGAGTDPLSRSRDTHYPQNLPKSLVF